MNHLEIDDSGIIYRANESIIYLNEINNDSTFEHLMKIEKDGNFKLLLNKISFDDNNILMQGVNNAFFILISKHFSDKPQKYILKEGDIFKLGRITLRVKEIKIVNNTFTQNKNIINSKNNFINFLNNNNFNNSIIESNILTGRTMTNKEEILQINKKSNKKLCRICYGEEDLENNNPLIQPCQCSGTMKFIHYQCLKKWINTQSFIKIDNNDFCSIFIIKNIECELCKSKFPDLIKYKNKVYEIIEFHSLYEKYIVLETLTFDSRRNKFLYVINLEKNFKNLRIGRGNECEITFTDVSISRIHCILIREGNHVVLKDYNSKFGTLILIHNQNLIINPDLSLNIQIGRTFFHIQIKQNFSLFNCCHCGENINEFYYHRQSQLEIKYEKNYLIKDNNNLNDDDNEEEKEDNCKKLNIQNESINDEKLGNVNDLKENKGHHKVHSLTFETSDFNFQSERDINTRNNNRNNIIIPFDSTEVNGI